MVGTRYAGRVPGGRGGGRGGGRDGGRGGRGGRGRGAGRGEAPPAVEDEAEAVLAADANPVVTEEGHVCKPHPGDKVPRSLCVPKRFAEFPPGEPVMSNPPIECLRPDVDWRLEGSELNG